MAPSDVDLPTPEHLQRSFPQLEITRLIGRGGMGAIYHARQRSLDRDVALKIIARNVTQDPAFEERFTREAKTLARLSHPNIVTVYDFGSTDDGMVYLLMEYVDGVNLREAMDAGGIRSDEAIQIVAEMCAALQFAHDRGVVHRDIKPENVMLNEDGVVKVADFGLAKLLGDSPADLTLTNTRQVMGTLRYMAPEQFENPSSVDHRADVYSLGVVFYELLTGQVPVGRFDAPSRINESVSPRLDEIVMRTLDRKPPNRYQRVSEIAAELSSMETASAVSGSLPPPYTESDWSSSVAFSASTLGNFAVSVGNLKLSDASLEVNYLTRDNIFHIVKSAAKTVRIPLSELARLEWRPGVFSSSITIAPKSLSLADQLPSAHDGLSVLKISSANSLTAAKLVNEASHRAPALRNSSTSTLTQKIAQSEATGLSWIRITLGVLFLACAALNIVAMIIMLVQLSRRLDDHPEIVVFLALIPLGTIATVVLQIVGGIFCFSPYTRRTPLAAATISILPMAMGWPVGFVVGLATWLTIGRSHLGNEQNRGIPLLKGLLGGSSSRMHTTLMYIRESRWSKFVAAANILGLLIVGAVCAVYMNGYYGVAVNFRVVVEQGDWTREAQEELTAEVDRRLQNLPGNWASIDRGSGPLMSFECLKSQEPSVRQALEIADAIQWAWIVSPEVNASDDGQATYLKVGGTIANMAIATQNSVRVAQQPTAMDANFCKSTTKQGNALELAWTTAGRETIETSKPTANAIGLALIVEGLVEGFAPVESMSIREAKFSMVEGSKFAPDAIQAAIRGPALSRPIEFLN
jgi:serine/threonine protein kinase